MRSTIPTERIRQYGLRTSGQVRTTLLELTRDFILAARELRGVRRIALVGSLLTKKSHPKDADVLVTLADDAAVASLARLGRRLKGSAQSRIDAGADVFLANSDGIYVGRICHYRECHPRALCRARHCGAIPHIADDLDVIALDAGLIANPPLELYPELRVRAPVPGDVETIVIANCATSSTMPKA